MSNFSENSEKVNKYRAEIAALIGDLEEIDEKILTRALNEGLDHAKSKTPTGIHPNPVTFVTEDGKVVTFRTRVTIVGGHLKKSWKKSDVVKTDNSSEGKLYNTADYALYWNDGHRLVLTKGGPTKKFVPGSHFAENKLEPFVNKRIEALFKKELQEIKRKYNA